MSRKQAVRAVAGSRYWREPAARVMVDAWRDSGETVAAFAARHGLDVRRLTRWVRKLEAKTDGLVPFHPVRLVSVAETQSAEAPIEIAIGATYCVRVPPGFRIEDLRGVLAVLERDPSC
jgi:transposase-like protein